MPYANITEAKAAMFRDLMRVLETYGWSTVAHEDQLDDLVEDFEFDPEVILPEDD